MTDRAEKAVALLIEKKLTVTTAESCTGGLIASALVDVAGVSEVYREGYITYSNEAKEKLLGVRKETIEAHTEVSAETAAEMAEGAAGNAGADLALSSTGIAGPGGGSAERPVGLVYLGLYDRGRIVTERHVFSGDRASVRSQAAAASIRMLYEALER